MPFLTVELRNEPGDVLARTEDEGAIARGRSYFDESTSACLRFIDPYGDTVFNPLQARVLSAELNALAATVTDRDDRVRLIGVADLSDRCADEVHVLLWFLGD